MNYFKTLFTRDVGALREAVQMERGPGLQWLASRFDIPVLLTLLEGSLDAPRFPDATLPVYPVDKWHAESESLHEVDEPVEDWAELLHPADSSTGLVLPNDSSEDPRLTLLSPSGAGLLPVWFEIVVKEDQLLPLATQFAEEPCGMAQDSGVECVEFTCSGECVSVRASGRVPGSRKCICVERPRE